MFGVDDKKVEYLKNLYTPGGKVKLLEMVGEPQMPYGLMGVVQFVDDIGQVHMEWENGSVLALHPFEDSYEYSAE